MRIAGAAAMVMTLLLGARDGATQPAPWAGQDTLVLSNGTALRGSVIHAQPGDHLTVRLPSGVIRVIRWSEIREARGPAFRRTVAAPPPAIGTDVQPGAAERYLLPRKGTVPLVLLSNGPALSISAVTELVGLAPLDDVAVPMAGSLSPMGEPVVLGAVGPIVHGLQLTYLCNTPCTLHIAPGRAQLHVGGPGRVESVQSIDVDADGSQAVLRSASSTVFGTGVVLALLGGSLGLGGAGALVLDAGGAGGSFPLATVGAVLLGIGVISLAVAVPILVHARTGLERRTPLGPTGPVRGR